MGCFGFVLGAFCLLGFVDLIGGCSFDICLVGSVLVFALCLGCLFIWIVCLI